MVECCHIMTIGAILLGKWFKGILILSLLLNVLLISIGGYEAYKKGFFAKKDTSKYPMNYIIQKTEYDSWKIANDDIEFFGDSLTDYGQWSEFFSNGKIINRGISGDDTERLLNRINEVGNPSKLFIMAGTNDLVEGKNLNEITSNYEKIISTISKGSPSTKIYVQSVLPFNQDRYKKYYPSYKHVNNSEIITLNNKLKSLSKKYNATFVDLYPSFIKNGNMNQKYTVDGVHLTGDGYSVWINDIRNYVSH